MAFANKQRKATYQCFMDMKQRCQNKNHKYYASYGGRGIGICIRWQSFDNFVEDMGLKPDGLSLDRIDNNKGYSKENCRWATKAQQVRNTRMTANKYVGISFCKRDNLWNARIKVDGKTKHLGSFTNIESAIFARKEGEYIWWGKAWY